MTVPLSDAQLAEAARAVARTKLAGLMPGQTGINMADEIADAVTAPLLAELAVLRACDCYPNPADHADRCPIFQAAFPESGENW